MHASMSQFAKLQVILATFYTYEAIHIVYCMKLLPLPQRVPQSQTLNEIN